MHYEKAQKIKGAAPESDFREFISDLHLPQESESQSVCIAQFSRLTSVILRLSLKRTLDENVYPLVYIHLAFIWSLIIVQQAWPYFENDIAWRIIERGIPWSMVCALLNHLRSQYRSSKIIFAQKFPQHSEEDCDKEHVDTKEAAKRGDKRKDRPLPEDFVLRGQVYSQSYFPEDWFKDTPADDDESTLELSSMVLARKKRMLWLGCCIASVSYNLMKPNDIVTDHFIQENRWIQYDTSTDSFVTVDYVNNNFNVPAKAVSVSTDMDSIMNDTSTMARTPRTLSHDPSQPPNDSFAMARLSTPLGSQATDTPQSMLPLTVEPERIVGMRQCLTSALESHPRTTAIRRIHPRTSS